MLGFILGGGGMLENVWKDSDGAEDAAVHAQPAGDSIPSIAWPPEHCKEWHPRP